MELSPFPNHIKPKELLDLIFLSNIFRRRWFPANNRDHLVFYQSALRKSCFIFSLILLPDGLYLLVVCLKVARFWPIFGQLGPLWPKPVFSSRTIKSRPLKYWYSMCKICQVYDSTSGYAYLTKWGISRFATVTLHIYQTGCTIRYVTVAVHI